MNYRLLITAILFAIVAPQGAATFAAEAAETAETADPATPPERSADTTTADDIPAEAPESADVFIPTEDISEDFAVSFPVDI